MRPASRNAVLAALGLALVLAVAWSMRAAARDEPAAAPAGPHYTVVETDGIHAIVTDNRADKLYFYSIDQDAKVGDELKLRGYVSLKDVGKPVLKPVTVSRRKP